MINNLDEAIAHAKEKTEELNAPADYYRNHDMPEYLPICIKRAKEEEQLVSWLEELKARREADKKGSWIGDTDYASAFGMYEAYKCSNCGYKISYRDLMRIHCNDIDKDQREYFCPHCGADMRKGGAEW